MRTIFLAFLLIVVNAVSAQQAFPGTTGASEGTNAMYWSSYPVCGNGASRAIGITASYTLLTDSTADTYQVYGSNVPFPHTDSTLIKDENGAFTARHLTTPYIRSSFPFRYIGIYYKKGGGTVTGTYTFYIDESSYSTTLQ